MPMKTGHLQYFTKRNSMCESIVRLIFDDNTLACTFAIVTFFITLLVVISRNVTSNALLIVLLW